MSDTQSSRPSKIQRTEGDAAATHNDVVESSGVAAPARRENTALTSVQPFSTASDFLSNVGRFKIIESTLRGMYFERTS